MKRILTLLCVSMVTGVVAEVEYGNLIGNEQSVTVAAGETFTVMANNFNMDTYGHHIQVYSPPSSTSPISLSFYIPDRTTSYSFGIIAGPCLIRLRTTEGYCSYKITRNEVCTSPMNIVALPEDNNGDVELLIETSTDLITWTPVYSGSAGTSNNAAFFRTRLITQ